MGEAQADAVVLHEQLRGPLVGGTAEVGHAHDRELQTLGGVDAHQADRVAVGQRRRVGLARAFLVLQVGDVVEEPPQVAALALLEAARQAGELVGVGELARLRGRQRRAGRSAEPGCCSAREISSPSGRSGARPRSLSANTQKRSSASSSAGARPQLGAGPDRQLEGPPAALLGGEREQRHAVVREPGERPGQAGVQRLLVERVGEHPQVGEQVFDLRLSQ